jgi:hypothetical protein
MKTKEIQEFRKLWSNPKRFEETNEIKLIKEPNSLGWSKVIYTDGSIKYLKIEKTIK